MSFVCSAVTCFAAYSGLNIDDMETLLYPPVFSGDAAKLYPTPRKGDVLFSSLFFRVSKGAKFCEERRNCVCRISMSANFSIDR